MKKYIIIGVVFVVICIVVGIAVNNDNNYDSDNKNLSDIYYKVDSKFENSKYGNYYHYYGEDISCNFDVSYFSTYSYKDGNQYLRNSVSFTLNDKVSDVEEILINNYKWYYMSVEGNSSKSYYYATVRNDKGYILEYKIRDYLRGDTDKDVDDFCYKEYDKILSSVKFK